MKKTSRAIFLNIVTALWMNALLQIALITEATKDGPVWKWKSIDPCLDAIECFGNRFNVTVSDPEDCSRYFVCVNTSLISSPCPVDTFYDYIINRCAANHKRCHLPCPNPSYKEHIIFEPELTVELPQDDSVLPSNSIESSLITTTATEIESPENEESEDSLPFSAFDLLFSRCATEKRIKRSNNVSSMVTASDSGESSPAWADPYSVGSDVGLDTPEENRSSTSIRAQSTTTTGAFGSKEAGSAGGVPTPFQTPKNTPLPPTPPSIIPANTNTMLSVASRDSTQPRSTASNPSTSDARTTAAKSSIAAPASHQSSNDAKQYTPALTTPSSVLSTVSSSTVPSTSTTTRLATPPPATKTRSIGPFTLESTIRTTSPSAEEVEVSTAPSVGVDLTESDSTVSVTPVQNTLNSNSSGTRLTESSIDELDSFVTDSSTDSSDQSDNSNVSPTLVESTDDNEDQSFTGSSASESIPKTSTEDISTFTFEAQLTSSTAASAGSSSSLSTSSAGSSSSLSTSTASTTSSRLSLSTSSRSSLFTDPATSATAHDQEESSSSTDDNNSNGSMTTTVSSNSSSLVSSISDSVGTDEETHKTDAPSSPPSFTEYTATLGENTQEEPFYPDRSSTHSSDLRSSTTRSSSSIGDDTGTLTQRSESSFSSTTSNTGPSPSSRPDVIRHMVSMTPSVPIEGFPLEFECSFSVDAVVQSVHVESMTWMLNDRVLSPPGERGGNDDNDDIVIRQVALNATTGVSYSTLVFRSVSLRYSGKVMCDVKYSQVFTSHAESNAFDVRPLPVVQLIPSSVTVLPKSNVMLTCSAIENEDLASRFGISAVKFEWFQNGTLVTNSGGDVTIAYTEKSSTLSGKISQSSEFSCRARNGFGVSENETAEVRVIKLKSSSGGELTGLDIEAKKLICMEDEEDGWHWTSTIVNFSVKVPCPPPSKGFATRQCVQGKASSFAQWMPPDASHCISGTLVDIWQQISDLESGIGSENETVISDLLFSFYDFVINRPPNSSYLPSGDYNSSITAVPKLLDIYSESPNSKFSFDDVDTIFEPTSALLDPFYNGTVSEDVEMGENKSPSLIMKSVDNFGKKWSKKLQPGQTSEVIKRNLAVQVEAQYAPQVQSLSYPRRNGGLYPAWMYSTVDRIAVEKETLLSKKPADVDATYGISSSYYRTLSNFFRFGQFSNSSCGLDSRILSLSIDGMPSYNPQPKVRITLQHRSISEDFIGTDLSHHCAFWNFSIQPNGVWSTVGCYRNLNGSNALVTMCECDHLTNFAVLVSPSTDTPTSRDELILSIISLIGCIISIVSLILTIVVYAMRWKKLKSHQAVVLINLCVALIIANVIFLAGVDHTEWHIGCQVVSVLLHYFFLAAFFLMLAEAFQLLLYTVFVFHVRRKRETAILIIGAWLIPLIIVAVSMGVSQMKGYGDSDSSCWLSPSTGVYWAFVGPVLAVILVNLVIMIIVLCRVARIQRPSEKKGSRERLRATLWNVMVIAPVLGVAWVFGVFSVNNNLVAFQYIFAVANSLQGLFIFIFHALCNRRRVKSKYSVPGLTSKQNQQKTSSRGQRSSSSYPQHHFPERQGNRLGSVPTESSDDIIIMGSASSERRPSEDTVDSLGPYRAYQTEITSESSATSEICSSESSASSGYRGEASERHSCNTVATEITHCEDEDQRL